MSAILSGDNVLVVGSTGFLGGHFAQVLRDKGHRVTGTTSKAVSGADQIKLDLSTFDGTLRDAAGYSRAVIFAGITNYDRCRDEDTRGANVVNTVRLIRTLLATGAEVTFISSNSVFGQLPGARDESAPTRPDIPYAEQKAEAEALAMEYSRSAGAEDRFRIIRLTKVLSREVSPFRDWLVSLAEGKQVVAATDFVFAPITATFAAESIYAVVAGDVSGILHLSGERDIGYYEFAVRMARRMGYSESQVIGKSMAEMGLKSQYVPARSMLDMPRTTRATSLQPQTVEAVIEELVR